LSAKEKLKIIQDAPSKYHFKTKDNNLIDIEHKDRRLKFKLHKWGFEASVEVSLGMVESDNHTYSKNRVELEDSKKKIRVYPIGTRSTADFYGDNEDIIQCQDGGLRYDIIYKEKPPTNFFDTPLVCKNTRWTKQPFLTQKDIDEGVRCPLNVEGSYAVYHATKKNNQYMTGKIVHVYRPIAEDALGNKAWCDIEVDRYIDPTNMRVTIPQQFLDEATYPVTIDPDFGYSTEGGSWAIIALGAQPSWRRGSAWSMPATSTANWIKAYVQGDGDPTDCKVFINQKDSVAANQHGQIATDENIACAVAAHWEEFTLASEALTEAVIYILNIIGNSADLAKNDKYQIAYDAGTASYTDSEKYAAPGDPWVTPPPADLRDYSIYCNYGVGWTGKISGVTNPAKIMGIPVAGIAKVKGIA